MNNKRNERTTELDEKGPTSGYSVRNVTWRQRTAWRMKRLNPARELGGWLKSREEVTKTLKNQQELRRQKYY